VTTQEHEAERSTNEEKDTLHGTVVLKRLIGPWAGSDRIVAADRYFASVQASILLKQLGLRFIGAIKTATRGFSMKALQARELSARGDCVTYVCESGNGNPELMALLWLDRECRCFIAPASSAIEGESYSRVRWRQRLM
jgi:Transposase IS4